MIWSHIDLKKGSSWLSDLLLTAPFPLNKRERNRWIRERQRMGRRTQQLAIGIQMMMMPPDLDVCTCLPADGGVSSTTPLHALSKWGALCSLFRREGKRGSLGLRQTNPTGCARERERKFDTCCRPSLEAEVIVRGFQWVNFPWCVKKKLIITLRTSDYFHLLC